jgi:hypothetical protein
MTSNVAIMVVLIVLIVSISSVIRSMVGARRDRKGNELPLQDSAETARMREEMKVLKDRVAVLERIATDRNHLLEQQFEQLRDS